MQHQKITQYAKYKYQVDSGAGDPIITQKGVEDMRVYLQNPNGVMCKDKRYDDQSTALTQGVGGGCHFLA